MALIENSRTPAPTQKLSSENQPSSVEPKAQRSPRRILSEHQKREVARLYAETTTPVPEIKRQFGVAESSLYQRPWSRSVPSGCFRQLRDAIVNRLISKNTSTPTNRCSK